MKKLFLSLCLFMGGLQAAPLPAFQAPFCPTLQSEAENETQKFRLAVYIYKASQKKYTDPTSLWDPYYLKHNPEIVHALQEFEAKTRAQSLHRIQVEGKTVEQLHQTLIEQGFSWNQLPLRVDQANPNLFWKTDGSQTSQAEDPQVVKMQIYIHPDGGMVRIKASGVPDKQAKYPKRLAHVVMAVLKTFDSRQCQKGVCPYDTSYTNEAFKVTRDGYAGPKSTSSQHGFKSPFKEITSYHKKLNRIAGDIYMDQVHTELKTSCPTVWDALKQDKTN